MVRKCESMVVGLKLSPDGSLESQVHAWSLGLQGLIRSLEAQVHLAPWVLTRSGMCLELEFVETSGGLRS